MQESARYLPAGDKAIIAEFGNEINEVINGKVRAMSNAIDSGNIKGIIEMIPTYRSLLVEYDPLEIGYEDLQNQLRKLEEQMDFAQLPLKKIVEIPVFYGGECGPDLEYVANYHNISVDDVIKDHTSVGYLIYMLGFTPGFPYLGGMSETIETPRLKAPRTKIPAGSVGIAGKQTGIYPIQSPGGWQLIGKTPVKLYDPYREPPILLKAGDYIRFVSVEWDDYCKIEEQVERNAYILTRFTE